MNGHCRRRTSDLRDQARAYTMPEGYCLTKSQSTTRGILENEEHAYRHPLRLLTLIKRETLYLQPRGTFVPQRNRPSR